MSAPAARPLPGFCGRLARAKVTIFHTLQAVAQGFLPQGDAKKPLPRRGKG